MDALRWVILAVAVAAAALGVFLFASVGQAPQAPSPITATANRPEQTNTPLADAVLVINGAGISVESFNAQYNALIDNYIRFYQQFGQDFAQQLEGEAGAYYQLDLRSQLVDQMIRDHLMSEQIALHNISVSEAEIQTSFENEYRNVLEQNGLTEADADTILRQQGSSLEQFQRELREQAAASLSQEQLVARVTGEVAITDVALIGFVEDSRFVYIDKLSEVLAPTELEMLTYYTANTDAYRQIKARHILIRVEENAPDIESQAALDRILSIRSRIEAGEDFIEVAKATSEDTVSGAQGGDLGFFGEGVMVRPFEEAAFSLEIGELSQPVRSPFGYHIIVVEEARVQPFEEVADAVRGQLLQQRQLEAFDGLLALAKAGDAGALSRLRDVAAEDWVLQRRNELFELWFEDVIARADVQLRLPAVAAYRLESIDLQRAINAYQQLRDNGVDPNAGYYLCQVYLRRFESTQTRIAELQAMATPTVQEQSELQQLNADVGLYRIQAETCQ